MSILDPKVRKRLLRVWDKFSRTEEFDIYVGSLIAMEIMWRIDYGHEFDMSRVIDNAVAHALLLRVKPLEGNIRALIRGKP